ncbi:MAG: L,D-transpeptidase family protein, partial [Pseudomonadota bacterium]
MNDPVETNVAPRDAARRASRALGALAPVFVLALASGCAALKPAEAPPAVEAPPPEPPLPAPVATHRFTIDPARDHVVGEVQVVKVGADDTFPDIARRFNVGYEELVRANPGVDPWLPGEGRELVVPTRFILPDAPREGVVVNVAAMRLFYYPKRKPNEPQVVITHPIGIGKVGWRTPEGVTKIVSRTQNPTWTPPASVRREHLKRGEKLPPRVPPGPDNPLGAHMFRLGWPSYLIHGTNKPPGVGMRSSHGCIRMYPEDIEELFDAIPIGTQVRIVNQPYLLGWRDEKLYVQAYGALEDDRRDWEHGPKSLLKRAAKSKSPLWQKIRAHDADIDWELARAQSDTPRGIPVPVMRAVPGSVDAVVAAARRVRNVLPDGATWDGGQQSLVSEAQFEALLGDR